MLTVFFFSAAFFSIPACSFRPVLNYVTWVFTAIFVILIFLSFIFYYHLRLDLISLFLIFFCISALISSLLNGIRMFSFTPLLLTFLTIVIYSYCKSNKSVVSLFVVGIFFSLLCFALFFFVSYWDVFRHLNFDRLGGLFGDENDVALFFGLGFLISCYFTFYSKSLWNKLLFALFCCFFILLGISTGSKIFILTIIVISVALIISFFGRKKWWASALLIVGLGIALIIILSLPFAETIRTRFFAFINTFFNTSNSGQTSTDFSSIQRLYMFFDGIEMFFRKPLFGFGINGFAIFGGLNQGWSHNHFSESLANFGLVGSILFNYGIFVSIIGFFNKKDKKVIIYHLMTIFFIVLMFSVALFTQKIYAFIIGIAYSELTDEKPYYTFPIFWKKKELKHD